MFKETIQKTSLFSQIALYFWMFVGAFLAAFAIEVFFIPNDLIDGGIVGVAMILGQLFGTSYIPLFLILFNFPFLFLAYRSIGKAFLVHMIVAVLLFALSMTFISNVLHIVFTGEYLEVVVTGGAILGVGLGLIIRSGGCLDGTEILGIILNRRFGFTVGQIVLFCNLFVFSIAGIIYQNWHPAILSFITYLIVMKVMDAVIVGFEETKSVIIISRKSKAIAKAIMDELSLGLTIIYGRGGFSGVDQEILYVIAERLQLHDLKTLIFREDPKAFIAIENLHEVANGMHGQARAKNHIETLFDRALGRKKLAKPE